MQIFVSERAPNCAVQSCIPRQWATFRPYIPVLSPIAHLREYFLCNCRSLAPPESSRRRQLRSFPSPRYIRHAARPGCTWLDEAALAAPPTRGPPCLARSPKPVAGWRGQTKTPAPRAVALRVLNRTFMAFKRAEASSPDWPPDKNAIPGTAAGTARKRHSHRGVGHLVHRFLLGAGQSRKHHVGLQDHRPPASPVGCKADRKPFAGLPPSPRGTAPGYASPSMSTSGSTTGTSPASWHNAA